MINFPEFFQDIKQRLSSPFFSSFIISWLIINWKVFVVIVFYSEVMLKGEGYISYNDFITKTINTSNGIIFPLVAALIYILIFPFIRNFFSAISHWFNRWGQIWDFDISKKGKIPMNKYLELRKSYIKRTKDLEEVLENEPKYIQEVVDLKKDLSTSKEELQKLSRQLELSRAQNDVKILDGRWKVNNFIVFDKKDLNFDNGSIEVISLLQGNVVKFDQVGFIKSFYIDTKNQKMFLFIEDVATQKQMFYPLKYNSDNIKELFGATPEFQSTYLQKL